MCGTLVCCILLAFWRNIWRNSFFQPATLLAADRHQRLPSGVSAEAVLAKSDMEASTAAAFLHENMLEFVDAEAIEDAANACLYLSHSGECASGAVVL